MSKGLHYCLAHELKRADGTPACNLQIPHRLLACPRHWGMVSQDAQRQLWRSYRRAPTGDGHAVLTTQYLTAVDRVRVELAEKLNAQLTIS